VLAVAFQEALDAADAAAAERPLGPPPMSLADFVRQAWDVLEPDTAFLDNWHIDAVCEHLEAATRSYALTRIDDPAQAHLVDDWWRQPRCAT
jgi:hypothetical protein